MIIGTGHRYGFRNAQAGHFEPESELVNHVLEDIATGIIPVKAPIHVTLRIKGTQFGFALKANPIDMLLVAVVWYFAQPTAIGRVAVMVRLDGGDLSHTLRGGQLPHLTNAWAAVHLHAD